jgi:hypothetical protein
MLLRLIHGRSHPDEHLDGWGFDGPTLRGVAWVTAVYVAEVRVGFVDVEAARAAQAITGWRVVDDVILEMRVERDLVCLPAAPTPAGTTGAWFGDWSLDEDLDSVVNGLAEHLMRLPEGQRIELLRRLGAALRPHAPEAADALEFPVRRDG